MSPTLTAHTKAAPACTTKHRRSRTPNPHKERSTSIMTDRRHQRRLDLAKVRVIGPPEIVDQVVDAITAALPTADPSALYPSSKNPGQVCVYLEVSPE